MADGGSNGAPRVTVASLTVALDALRVCRGDGYAGKRCAFSEVSRERALDELRDVLTAMGVEVVAG